MHVDDLLLPTLFYAEHGVKAVDAKSAHVNAFLAITHDIHLERGLLGNAPGTAHP